MRFSVIGAALMVGVLVVGFTYRYFLIKPQLSVAPRIPAMMMAGAITTGMGMALLRNEVQQVKRLFELVVRLLRTVVGVTCIATTLAIAALMLEELMTLTSPNISYAQAATMVLIGGGITGMALFLMDVRSEQGG